MVSVSQEIDDISVPTDRRPHSRRGLQQSRVVAEPGAGRGAEQPAVDAPPPPARGPPLSLVLPSRRQGTRVA